MSGFSSRPLSTHLRQPSLAPQGQSPALLARVNEKRAELENLKELRDLSAAVAAQMEALEQKLSTLSNGTEGVYTFTPSSKRWGLVLTISAIATVLANWHNVLRAINMASSMPSPMLVRENHANRGNSQDP